MWVCVWGVFVCLCVCVWWGIVPSQHSFCVLPCRELRGGQISRQKTTNPLVDKRCVLNRSIVAGTRGPAGDTSAQRPRRPPPSWLLCPAQPSNQNKGGKMKKTHPNLALRCCLSLFWSLPRCHLLCPLKTF